MFGPYIGTESCIYDPIAKAVLRNRIVYYEPGFLLRLDLTTCRIRSCVGRCCGANFVQEPVFCGVVFGFKKGGSGGAVTRRTAILMLHDAGLPKQQQHEKETGGFRRNGSKLITQLDSGRIWACWYIGLGSSPGSHVSNAPTHPQRWL